MSGSFLTPARRAILVELYAERAPAVERLLSDYTLPTAQHDPVLSLFFSNTRSPRRAAIDYLLKNKQVPIAALMQDGDGDGYAIGEALIEIEGCRFDFAFAEAASVTALRALIVVARNEEGEPLDLIAWSPRTNTIVSHMGRAVSLGAHELDHVELNGAVPVRRDMIEWLSANRTGIVIIDAKRAWRLLLEMRVEAAGIEHGSELQKTLRPPMPKVCVRELVGEDA